LFIADALQAIGAVMDLKWIGTGQVEAGQFCSAQGEFLFAFQPEQAHLIITSGIIQQLGEVNVAITTGVSCLTVSTAFFLR
jgi:hypothetical protein